MTVLLLLSLLLLKLQNIKVTVLQNAEGALHCTQIMSQVCGYNVLMSAQSCQIISKRCCEQQCLLPILFFVPSE